VVIILIPWISLCSKIWTNDRAFQITQGAVALVSAWATMYKSANDKRAIYFYKMNKLKQRSHVECGIMSIIHLHSKVFWDPIDLELVTDHISDGFPDH
jgi:hypothetical protein